jgi:probable F420-dependent oxidoreductase
MKASIGLPTSQVDQIDEFATAAGIGDMAQAAERCGFDAVWVTDHPFPSVRWLEQGWGGHHTLDPIVALTAAAAATTTLRLQTHVFILAYRNSFAVAKSMSTLDVVSGGRLIMGVGTGHLKSEFAVLGQVYDDRHDRTDQGIREIRAAWTGEPTVGHRMLPRPLQRPAPPIWVGGNSPRSIRRAVEFGDGWAPMPNPKSNAIGMRSPALETPDDLRALLDIARDHAERIGRSSPFDVAVMPIGVGASASSADELVEHAEQLADAGATYLVLRADVATRAEWIEACERLGSDVLPKVERINPVDPLDVRTTSATNLNSTPHTTRSSGRQPGG